MAAGPRTATEHAQEEQDIEAMFMSMMKEFKDFKQTVIALTDNPFEDERGEAPSKSRTPSKKLLTEVVQELDLIKNRCRCR